MTLSIIVDVMGGDNSPEAALSAVRDFHCSNSEIDLILVGDSDLIFKHLKDFNPKNASSIEVVHADDNITMKDSPASSYRKKRGSSIHTGLEILSKGGGDAFFSVGNTGAILTGAYFILKLIPSISRPALAVSFNSFSGRKVLALDMGVNVEVSSENLLDFARMGSVVSPFINETSNPEIALLNIGEEEGKGKKIISEAYSKISSYSSNFTGYIEPHHIFDKPSADVIVTDGFTGNVMLKTVEGISEAVSGMFRTTLNDGIYKDIVHKSISRFNYTIYGTGILLGVEGLIGIGHGRSNSIAFKSGLKKMKWYLENDVHKKFREKIVHEKRDRSER